MAPERSVISNQLTWPKKILTLASVKASDLTLDMCLIKLTLHITVFICELTFSTS
jgi:hypothetical protein